MVENALSSPFEYRRINEANAGLVVPLVIEVAMFILIPTPLTGRVVLASTTIFGWAADRPNRALAGQGFTATAVLRAERGARTRGQRIDRRG